MTTRVHLKRLAFGILAALLVSGAWFEAPGQEAVPEEAQTRGRSGALFEDLRQDTPKSQAATNTSIVEMLKKRQAVLEQLVKVQSEAYQHGEASMEGLAQAQQELVQVKLELATTDDERIKLLEESVGLARAFEKVASARYRAAQTSEADVFRAEAATLKAEVDLLRERQKSANDTDVGEDRDSHVEKEDPGTPAGARSMTRGSILILRSAGEFANKLRVARSELETLLESHLFVSQRSFKAKEEQLSILRAELDAQLRLLELEVQDARRDVAVATKHLELTRMVAARAMTQTKLIAAQVAVGAAKSRLQRAETLLALYSKIDEGGGTTPAPRFSGRRESKGATPAESSLGEIARSRRSALDESAALRLRNLRAFMMDIHVESKSGTEREDLKFDFKPLLRYSDPTRGVVDSCVFRIGTTGRPPAIVTAELYGRLDQPRVLLNHEFIAVNDPDLRLTRDAFVWEPPANAVKFVEFDDAPVPEKHKHLRLTQMQRLADKFQLTETWRGAHSDLERFGAAIHRYEPSGQVNADGTLFVFGLGENPEALLFIETDGQKWTWGCAPMGAAKLKATIDEKVVWEFAGGESQKSLRTAAYAWLHVNETFPVDDVDPMP